MNSYDQILLTTTVLNIIELTQYLIIKELPVLDRRKSNVFGSIFKKDSHYKTYFLNLFVSHFRFEVTLQKFFFRIYMDFSAATLIFRGSVRRF
jgi:hypothetical protein